MKTEKSCQTDGSVTTIGGREFRDAMKRRSIDATDVSSVVGLSVSTVRGWGSRGVPTKWVGEIPDVLRRAELEAFGAEHVDMFPETLNDEVL